MMWYSIVKKTITDNHSNRYPYFSNIILHCICNTIYTATTNVAAGNCLEQLRSDLVPCNFQPNTLMYYSSTVAYPLYINDIVQEICIVFGLHWHYRRRWVIPYISQFKICFLLYQDERQILCCHIFQFTIPMIMIRTFIYIFFYFMVQAHS